MGSSGVSALVFIINAVAQLYLLVLLLRLLMPWFGIDFNNPISQAILKATSPLVHPLRRVIPAIGKIDTATLVVAYAVQYLTILVIVLIYGVTPSILAIAITAAVNLVVLTLRLFVFAILIRVILSWIAPGGYNPAIGLINSITEPVLRPFRRLIPPLGGLDLSPIAAMILLSAAAIFVSGAKQLPV